MWLLIRFSPSWDAGLEPSSLPYHAGHSDAAAGFIKAHKPKRQQRECDGKTEVTVSCNLILKTASIWGAWVA